MQLMPPFGVVRSTYTLLHIPSLKATRFQEKLTPTPHLILTPAILGSFANADMK